MDNFIDETSDAAFDKVVDSARLNWDRMVEKYSDLPSDAETGKTIGVKEDSKVYRYNGTDWDDIYEINLNPISEVDDILSSQLAETVYFEDYTINKHHDLSSGTDYYLTEIKVDENTQIVFDVADNENGKKTR